jgi:hypothetical protein
MEKFNLDALDFHGTRTISVTFCRGESVVQCDAPSGRLRHLGHRTAGVRVHSDEQNAERSVRPGHLLRPSGRH